MNAPQRLVAMAEKHNRLDDNEKHASKNRIMFELVGIVEAAAKVMRSLEARADLPGEYSPAEQSAYRVAAQELRAVLEGVEE